MTAASGWRERLRAWEAYETPTPDWLIMLVVGVPTLALGIAVVLLALRVGR